MGRMGRSGKTELTERSMMARSRVTAGGSIWTPARGFAGGEGEAALVDGADAAVEIDGDGGDGFDLVEELGGAGELDGGGGDGDFFDFVAVGEEVLGLDLDGDLLGDLAVEAEGDDGGADEIDAGVAGGVDVGGAEFDREGAGFGVGAGVEGGLDEFAVEIAQVVAGAEEGDIDGLGGAVDDAPVGGGLDGEGDVGDEGGVAGGGADGVPDEDGGGDGHQAQAFGGAEELKYFAEDLQIRAPSFLRCGRGLRRRGRDSGGCVASGSGS
jgi:hypothetical protein